MSTWAKSSAARLASGVSEQGPEQEPLPGSASAYDIAERGPEQESQPSSARGRVEVKSRDDKPERRAAKKEKQTPTDALIDFQHRLIKLICDIKLPSHHEEVQKRFNMIRAAAVNKQYIDGNGTTITIEQAEHNCSGHTGTSSS